MAKQNGLVKLLGTIGDMTYYKSRDGYMAKEKTIISADRIASDPQFSRTRCTCYTSSCVRRPPQADSVPTCHISVKLRNSYNRFKYKNQLEFQSN